MTWVNKLSKVRGLQALIDHPNTPHHEREAAKRALVRIGPLPKHKPELCYWCAFGLGMKDGDFMVFSTTASCELCGQVGDVSEDWVID